MVICYMAIENEYKCVLCSGCHSSDNGKAAAENCWKKCLFGRFLPLGPPPRSRRAEACTPGGLSLFLVSSWGQVWSTGAAGTPGSCRSLSFLLCPAQEGWGMSRPNFWPEALLLRATCPQLMTKNKYAGWSNCLTQGIKCICNFNRG